MNELTVEEGVLLLLLLNNWQWEWGNKAISLI
jgi:hypothetical protein